MPVTHNIDIIIDGAICELGKPSDLGLRYSYALEDPQNFESKQGGMIESLTLPATPTNDRIFNSYHRTKVADLTGTDAYTNPRSCQIIVNGINLLNGKAILKNATHTRMPEDYALDCYNQNGDWVIDMANLTIWDCLSTTPHNFDVATIEASWNDFDSDEDHDYVYFPVRYRQPFGANDDAVNIYALRPSISIYWLLQRGFRQFGYKIDSAFLDTANYFRRLVIPWVWGDFYDINSQLTDGLSFKAVGDISDMLANELPPTTAPGSLKFWSGSGSGTLVPSPHGTVWIDTSSAGGLAAGGFPILAAGGDYVFTGNILANNNFRMNNVLPPNGYDNFGLYSFDDTTGTMSWVYNPPAAIATFFGNNITANFQLNLLLVLTNFAGANSMVAMEVTHTFYSGAPDVVTNNSIMPSGGAVVGATSYPDSSGYPLIPTVYNFPVNNISQGDTIKFRLRALTDGGGASPHILIFQSGLLNLDPGAGTVSGWQYDFTTQRYVNLSVAGVTTQWQQMYSSLTMTGLQLQVGNPVHFQFYDKFRSYKFLDLLRGLVDAFNLSIQTDPINRVVTIEPTHDYVLPDGTQMDGYFKKARIDWTDKQDISQKTPNFLFSDNERQFDFAFKGDGSDGGLNIFAARYKAAYLNNKIATSFNNLNNSNNDNGIISAIPGASRFMFPPRFQRGTKNMVNRFFAPTMHYLHQKWADIPVIISGGTGTPLAPQLIAIIPENVSDSSANSISQTFEPKMVFYSGTQALNGVGGWQWVGDPAGRGYDANGVGIPTYNDPTDYIQGQPLSVLRSKGFLLPYAFAVDYTGFVQTVPGQLAPVLTYSDQLIAGVPQPGLMKSYFLKRLATIRNGRLYKPFMRLTLADIMDWEHRNKIIIDNALFHLIGIDSFDPLSEKSTQCTLWMAANPTEDDINNCFPSETSILTSPTILPQFDLKYAKLLLFPTDLPQIG